jgi:hypothetical protein
MTPEEQAVVDSAIEIASMAKVVEQMHRQLDTLLEQHIQRCKALADARLKAKP